ncbi:MAG: J domain-containing protein [Spirochaetaceae bacterium]|nr:MAG: J domain-containing protein [Spirochaetaceae bacterium]
MSDFFDRLGSIFKSIFTEDEKQTGEGSRRYFNDDMQDAWDELEDYLNEGKADQKPRTKRAETSQKADVNQLRRRARQEALKQDYANLKVPFGASFQVVKDSYKKLLRQYHPDKHASDPAKQKLATEITQKINQSYQKIRDFEENRNSA